LVISQCDDTRGIPPVTLPDGFAIREMDTDVTSDVLAWLEVHNDAYEHTWGSSDFEQVILEHPVVRVDRTFFILRGDDPVAVASAGVFRRNEAMGVGHYLGVKRGSQGFGLGRAIVTHRFAWLARAGITAAESQTHISRHHALRVHFDLGFRPKYRFDAWNSEDPVSRPVRLLANGRLWTLHRQWQRGRAKDARPDG
jgi:GNAT superfamily N-acetyltransferase